jgi:hypothetical protein
MFRATPPPLHRGLKGQVASGRKEGEGPLTRMQRNQMQTPIMVGWLLSVMHDVLEGDIVGFHWGGGGG